MASADPWSEFEIIRHNVKLNTVDKLKQILAGLNDECGVYLPRTGKKQEIIDRIVSTLDNWKAQNYLDKWAKARAILYQVRTFGVYSPARPSTSNASPPTANPVHAMKPPPYPAHNTLLNGHYDPYPPPRKPSGSLPSTSGPPKPLTSKPVLRFKDSPFFEIDQPVSSVVECPESNSSTDRRQQNVMFALTNDQIAKLKSHSPKYELRLYCTSSIFYSPNPTFRTNTAPCLIEFPPTCEVRVNNVQVTASLKGLKKKPGTAPPPDLGKYVRMGPSSNKVEMVYVNSQQPVQSKKFYLVVMLVRTTPVESLVDKLAQTGYTDAKDIQAKMKASMSDDDDIIVGPQKMSLKCPLSFMRVQTPCRSSKCVHPQCFDATSWFSMMEQTTTWLCPVCEKVLDHKDLIIDGYFDSILHQCPDSVDDVFVEADGEWHTADSKYGSAPWKAKHPPDKPTILLPPRRPLSAVKSLSLSNGKPPAGPEDKPRRHPSEIVILDSDDEDEGRVKRELSVSFGNSSSPSLPDSQSTTAPPPSAAQSQAASVIDLTLDDSDDEIIQSKTAGKRKAADAELTSVSPTEPIWKKGRTENDRSAPVPLTAIDRDYIRTAHQSPHQYHPSPVHVASNGGGGHFGPFYSSTGHHSSSIFGNGYLDRDRLPSTSGHPPSSYISRVTGSSSSSRPWS
ncbi:uncharacterized protein BT62DRAFT_927854 [Guyanagaster necrorhizus]|uniref:Uncharacterized protein n=1 Tax=Guyanagaster necrorhizus TaxID=856835 RepID=A0A9P7W0X5_9AGAR|nr:uncharacterized protein BT62DRAFT_927854 [Guyanagaster necrorhizus MCA 3950]KAG7450572.1 hypothetical protein BT62DRAFT_927854 [Guyanagaster necrorhizus MCA 3950]